MDTGGFIVVDAIATAKIQHPLRDNALIVLRKSRFCMAVRQGSSDDDNNGEEDVMHNNRWMLLQHANNENGGQCRQDEEDELNVETVVGIAVALGREVCHGWGRLGQHKSGQ